VTKHCEFCGDEVSSFEYYCDACAANVYGEYPSMLDDEEREEEE